MAKLSVVPRSVNPFRPSISHQIGARIPCPWCGSQMYLDHIGERLLCVDTIHAPMSWMSIRSVQRPME